MILPDEATPKPDGIFGKHNRNVILSPHLLDLLREWWKAARPQGWLFPGRDPVQPMTTRQLDRACHAAAQLGPYGVDGRDWQPVTELSTPDSTA